MMKRILGFAAGACAKAGRVIVGKLNVAKATAEIIRLPIRAPIFMMENPPLGNCDRGSGH
jgi:hypothetical protein